jgi:hypothetical protein
MLHPVCESFSSLMDINQVVPFSSQRVPLRRERSRLSRRTTICLTMSVCLPSRSMSRALSWTFCLAPSAPYRECMPLLVVECDRHLTSVDRMNETFLFLSALGYAGAFVNGKKLLPLSNFNLDVHQNTDGEWFWKKRGIAIISSS